MRFTEFNNVEPEIGDVLGLELGNTLVEATIVDLCEDGVVVEFDATTVNLISTVIKESRTDEGLTKHAMMADAERMGLEQFMDRYGEEDWVKEFWMTARGIESEEDLRDIDEAKYQGREVPLGKPMKGDVKKSKVYVKGPKGNVVKVNFGDPNMKIKKSNPARRKSFRARHNCANPGPRWKARYWSCRAW